MFLVLKEVTNSFCLTVAYVKVFFPRLLEELARGTKNILVDDTCAWQNRK
jgi:hypothetical protein